MTATAQKAPERMSAQEIDAELFEVREDERLDRTRNDSRDFTTEANAAQNGPGGGDLAREIRAEGVIYEARCRRRAVRIAELESALEAMQAADVSKDVEALSASHASAMSAAKKALAAVDFTLLDRFEAQLDEYLEHAQAARNAAVEAATIARRGGAQHPGLAALKAEQVEGLYDRLHRLAGRTSAPDLQSRRDQTYLDVQRVTLD